MTNKEYVIYIDTDSLFVSVFTFLESQGISKSQWESLDRGIRTEYCLKIAKVMEDNVNYRAYNETQLEDFNSILDQKDFCIGFKQELVCSKALFLASKMYAFHILNEEGFDCDKMDAKGIETVRSNSPRVFRSTLKHILERLLKGDDDDDLVDIINQHKKTFADALPEDISTNIGVNNIPKYVNPDFTYIKGTPYQVKGAANYHWLLKELDIGHKYEPIKEGDKIKLVYLKKNKYGMKNVAYYTWPTEFNEVGVVPDVDIMVEKYFINKAKIILDPINKGGLLNDNTIMDEFF
jgi:DNA polymerase elongation subunit (family B)